MKSLQGRRTPVHAMNAEQRKVGAATVLNWEQLLKSCKQN